MEQNSKSIRFTLPDSFSDDEIKELISDVKQFKPHIERVRPEPYAAMEWIIPTAFGVYLAKPYFDSFLGEAGKDHYVIFKGWIKKLATYSRKKFKSKIIASSGSEMKTSDNYTQSSAISLSFDLSNNKRLKLLFDLTLNESEWDNAIEDFFNLLLEHYRSYPNDSLTKETDSLTGRFCYAIIDKHTLKWIFLDDKAMHERLSVRAGHD